MALFVGLFLKMRKIGNTGLAEGFWWLLFGPPAILTILTIMTAPPDMGFELAVYSFVMAALLGLRFWPVRAE
jgi:hypothetical protein